MPVKKCFAAPCIFAAVFACFLLVSRGSEKAAPAEELAAEEGGFPEGNYPEAGLLAAPDKEAGTQDMILELYRNDAYPERVVDFFGNLAGSRDLAVIMLANAAAFDIPPALAFSLCWEESRYNPLAINGKNRNLTVDRGLFQLNNASFPNLKEDQFFNPRINAWYGLAHLRWCLDTAGTEVAGLAMYNAGAARVRSGGTPKMTLDYISRILERKRRIEELFMTEYELIVKAEESENEKPGFRMSLLAPLGRR